MHLARLTEMEYLVAHRSNNNGYEYELVYDMASTDNTLRFPGLADIDALKHAYDASRSGQSEAWPGPSRPSVGPWPGGGRVNESAQQPHPADVPDESIETESKPHLLRSTAKTASYPHVATASLAAAAPD